MGIQPKRIYKIVNIVDGKFYAGGTCSLCKRGSHHCHHLQNVLTIFPLEPVVADEVTPGRGANCLNACKPNLEIYSSVI